MKERLVSTLFLAFLLLAGCGQKAEIVPVLGWTKYQDPYFQGTFSYPQGWHTVVEGTKISIYSSQDVVRKFFDPTSKEPAGILIVASYREQDSFQSIETYVDSIKNDLTASGYTVDPIELKQMDGLSALQLSYSGRFDDNTTLQTARVFAKRDSLLYSLSFSAFNNLFTPNRYVFDSLITSFRLPAPKQVVANVDPSLPSGTFVEFENANLQLSHPENFEPSFPQPKGEQQFVLELTGYRQDCSVHIDAQPAKGLTADKVYEQNSKKFPNAGGTGEATVDGVKAIHLTYSPVKNVESKVYFLVKQDKMYRIILNYYQPKKKDYLPVFEKVVASLRLK